MPATDSLQAKGAPRARKSESRMPLRLSLSPQVPRVHKYHPLMPGGPRRLTVRQRLKQVATSALSRIAERESQGRARCSALLVVQTRTKLSYYRRDESGTVSQSRNSHTSCR